MYPSKSSAGIGLGIVLERRCRRSRLLKSAQRGELLALQNVEVIAPPPAELVTAEQLTGKKSTRGIGIQARAISSDKVVSAAFPTSLLGLSAQQQHDHVKQIPQACRIRHSSNSLNLVRITLAGYPKSVLLIRE